MSIQSSQSSSSSSSVKIQVDREEEFPLLFELQNIGSQELLNLASDFMDEASIIEMSKTCKFFRDFFEEKREQIQQDYSYLMQTNIFKSLKEISDLPTITCDNIYSLETKSFTHPLTKIVLTDKPSSDNPSSTKTICIAFKYVIYSNNTLSETRKEAVEILGAKTISFDETSSQKYLSLINRIVYKNAPSPKLPSLIAGFLTNRLQRLLRKEPVGEFVIRWAPGFRSSHSENMRYPCQMLEKPIPHP